MQPARHGRDVMRTRVLCSIALLLVVALAAPASAGMRSYRGETSAGTDIGFRVRSAGGELSLLGLRFHAILTCEDASTVEYWSAWRFGGGIPFDGRRLSFEERFGSEALVIEGRFRAQTAEGMFRNSQAWLTDDEEAQLCTTGDLTWEAARPGSASAPRVRPRGAPDRIVRRAGVTVRSWVGS